MSQSSEAFIVDIFVFQFAGVIALLLRVMCIERRHDEVLDLVEAANGFASSVGMAS